MKAQPDSAVVAFLLRGSQEELEAIQADVQERHDLARREIALIDQALEMKLPRIHVTRAPSFRELERLARI